MKSLRIQKKVKFPRGIHTMHIPFMASMSAYDPLYVQIDRLKLPKSVRRIEASLRVCIDLKGGQTELAQVSVMK